MATRTDPDSWLQDYRSELTAHCYRMLGSAADAEDAVQQTLVRAWKAIDRFEGRAQLRSWLYRIATNVCLDMLGGKERRSRPVDFGPVGRADGPAPGTLPEVTWLQPVPDALVVAPEVDPAEQTVTRETVRLAFVAALQHLPPRQRAVLILREVLRWPASDVAELLGSSVASVNSALQRARATLDGTPVAESDLLDPADDQQQALLARYVDAFERYDMDSLTALLHEDATMSMPPYALWLLGPAEIRAWHLGKGIGCQGSRLVPTRANGLPAFGQYRSAGPGRWEPWSVQVLEIHDGRIGALNSFLDTETLFPLFGLPPYLES